MSSINHNVPSVQDETLRYIRQDSLKFGIVFVSFVVIMILLAVFDQKTGFLTSLAASLMAKIGVSL